MSRRKIYFITILSFMIIHIVYANTPMKLQTGEGKEVDFSQAELMLDFLQGIAKGEHDPGKIEAILKAEGTDLVIMQMNIMRKVTKDQYRQVLNGLIEGTLPDILPADSSERSIRGIHGLIKNVWPALQWAIINEKILNERLNTLKSLNLYDDARSLMLKYLPEPVGISPLLFFVIGGRAGAAALAGERIYYDLNVMSFSRARKNMPFTDKKEIMEFFAHEMHHLAMRKILKKKRSSLNLDDNQKILFSFISSFISEGSATYLISEHRDIEKMRGKSSYSGILDKSDELLSTCEGIVHSIIEGKIRTDEDYDKATAPFIGNTYHSIGSLMLSVIERVNGLEPIMEIMSDPRKLLSEYNKAAKDLKLTDKDASLYLFDSKLAKRILTIGE